MENEPFNKTKDVIDKYHRLYVFDVLFYPRKKDGSLKIPVYYTEEELISEKERFWFQYKQFDLPDWYIESFWKPYEQQQQVDQGEGDENLLKLMESMGMNSKDSANDFAKNPIVKDDPRFNKAVDF